MGRKKGQKLHKWQPVLTVLPKETFRAVCKKCGLLQSFGKFGPLGGLRDRHFLNGVELQPYAVPDCT